MSASVCVLIPDSSWLLFYVLPHTPLHATPHENTEAMLRARRGIGTTSVGESEVV
jgi:hypothetical protein